MVDRTIDIYVEPDGSGGYKHWLKEGKNTLTGAVVFDKNQHNGMKKTDIFDVHFKLHNVGAAKLRFSCIPEKALWAKPIANVTEPCPDCDSYWSGFYLNPNKTFDANEFWVVNPDMNKELFAFAFNCIPKGTVEGPGTKYVWIDPIGDNRNGGLSGPRPIGISSFNSTVGLTALAIGALAVAYFVLR